MTNETKYAIIQWVTKVLGYHRPIFMPFNERTVKIIKVECNLEVKEQDLSKFKDFILGQCIGDELIKKKLLNINCIKKEGALFYVCTANLEVIKR